MKKYQVGIIGVGGMGSVHLSSLLALSHSFPLEIAAIADITPAHLEAALKKCPQARGYQTGDELLDHEKLDIVYVTLPSYLHAHHAIRALDNGANVFCEKPLALTKEDGEQILEAEKRSHHKAMVGQVVRFFPEFAYLKKIIDDKTYGSLKSLDLLRASSVPTWGYDNWFLDEKRSGSVILDLHIHDVDFIRYLSPKVHLLSTSASSFEKGEVNRVVSLFADPDGATFSAEGVWHLEQKVPFISSYRAELERATIICQMFSSPAVTVYEKERSFSPSFPAPSLEGAGVNISDLGAYFIEDSYFLDCIVNDKPNLIAPLSEGYESLLMGLEELSLAHGGNGK